MVDERKKQERTVEVFAINAIIVKIRCCQNVAILVLRLVDSKFDAHV